MYPLNVAQNEQMQSFISSLALDDSLIRLVMGTFVSKTHRGTQTNQAGELFKAVKGFRANTKILIF